LNDWAQTRTWRTNELKNLKKKKKTGIKGSLVRKGRINQH
jgi:hypothetical protein